MDNVSQPSTCLRNCETVEEDLKDESLAVGHRKRLSASLSFSADDLRSLVVQDKELDKNPSLRAGISKDESENEMVSSKASTSDSDAQLNPKAAAQRWGLFDVLKKGSMLGITTFGANISSLRIVNMKKPTKPTGLHTFHPGIPAMKIMAGKRGRNSRHSLPMMDPSLENGLNCFKSSWKNFSLLELQTATNNFTPDNLIGEGGYAEVYKGLLQDGQLVAIKQLTRGSQEDMTADFLSELGMLVHVNHRNIANVIGYGIEGGMHLVLHLSPHGSLASLLTGAKEKLDWSTRFKIALGAAEGLSYLHEGCQRRIIHRDIKAANILLTEDFEPQICDFGLAKWLPDQWSHLTVSTFEGTFGYLPPEVFINGVVDEKTDVYAYGVLLLELISGRLALDKTQKSLLVWAKPLLLKNDVYELVDPSLDHAYNKEEMNRMVLTATLCIHDSPEERPQMSKVVRMLTGNDIESLQRAKKLKARPSLKRTVSMGVYSGEECISAMYMNDNQHLRIALGL